MHCTYIIDRADGIIIIDDDAILLTHRPRLQLLPAGLVVRFRAFWHVLNVIDPFFEHLQLHNGRDSHYLIF